MVLHSGYSCILKKEVRNSFISKGFVELGGKAQSPVNLRSELGPRSSQNDMSPSV